MAFLEVLHEKLLRLGVDAELAEDRIVVKRGEGKESVGIHRDHAIEEAYKALKGYRSCTFDHDSRILQYNNTVEVNVLRLTPYGLGKEPIVLTDALGSKVSVGVSSSSYQLAVVDSPLADIVLKAVPAWLEKTKMMRLEIRDLLPTIFSASYSKSGRAKPPNLVDIAIDAIRSSLFKISVERAECFEVWLPRSRLKFDKGDGQPANLTIPRSTYNKDVVSFYKVAKSSPYPSQSFLAYYHCLEYYFLRVAEMKLHDHLAALLNQTSFTTDAHSLDKIISLIRGQDQKSDEVEMLRNVLHKFVIEADLIQHIERVESAWSLKVYTKRRRIFGEEIEISAKPGHVIGNAAKALKHIRNAIVHSSDRYSREDCHIPLSNSEDKIAEFVPLVQFCAEQVIFGAAKG